MSQNSHISIRSLQHPYIADSGSLALGHNYSFNTNPELYHPDSSPKVFGLNPLPLGPCFSGPDLGMAVDTSAVHSSHLPNCGAQDPHVQFSSPYLWLGGMNGDTMSWAPSDEPEAEPEGTSMTLFTPHPPKQAQSITATAPTFLDVKGTLLPEISPHVQGAVDPEGRRQWYCRFPHCTRSPFLRRDRAETHVASAHLHKKRIICKGSCGTVGW